MAYDKTYGEIPFAQESDDDTLTVDAKAVSEASQSQNRKPAKPVNKTPKMSSRFRRDPRTDAERDDEDRILFPSPQPFSVDSIEARVEFRYMPKGITGWHQPIELLGLIVLWAAFGFIRMFIPEAYLLYVDFLFSHYTIAFIIAFASLLLGRRLAYLVATVRNAQVYASSAAEIKAQSSKEQSSVENDAIVSEHCNQALLTVREKTSQIQRWLVTLLNAIATYLLVSLSY